MYSVVVRDKTSFLNLNNVSLYVHVIFSLSIHPSVGIWVTSTFFFCLLWIILLSTWECKYLFKTPFSVLLDTYPEVGLLNYIVVLFFIFWGASILFSRAIAPFYSPTNTAQGFQFLPILTRIYHLFFISDNLVWFWFAFLWWLVMLNIFSCACWSFVCHLWRNVYLSLCPFLNHVIWFFVVVGVLSTEY